MLWGYVRVAEDDDVRDQITEFFEAAVAPGSLLIDRTTCRQAGHERLLQLLSEIGADDVLVVGRLSALGRTVSEVVGVGAGLARIGAHLRVLRPSIDTRADGPGVLTTFSVLSELKPDLPTSSPPSARGERRKVGRPPRLTPQQAQQARTMRAAGVTITHIARQLEVPRSTVYGHLR